MKVLMVNSPLATKFKGGDSTQMRKTGEALQKLGVQVAECYERQPDAHGYDVAHIFNLRTLPYVLEQVQALKAQGIPIVLSPIYLDSSLALWANRCMEVTFGDGSGKDPKRLERSLRGIAARDMVLTFEDKSVLAAGTKNRPGADFDQRQREVLKHVDYLLPNSLLEHRALVRALGDPGKPVTVVPYAVDARIFADPDPEPFVKRFGVRDFVLQAGRIERSKNNLFLAMAMKDQGLPLVFVGNNLQPEYLAAIREHGVKDFLHVPHLPPEELRSAYAAARVHALPSWIETCGLVHMEAALADCTLVLSTAGFEREYYGNDGYYCDPGNYLSIRHAVKQAFANHAADAPMRKRLRERIERDYTWERAAELTLQAYQSVLTSQRTPVAAVPSLLRPEAGHPRPGPVRENGPHVLYVHKNFPAQFGHIAARLRREHDFQCTFVSELPPGFPSGIRRIQYQAKGGATDKTHYCSRSFELATWHAHGIYETMKNFPEVKPDLVVGHSGFGSTHFLRDLYDDCPILNYFEYFYRKNGGDMNFRPNSRSEINDLRARTRNATILLDLDTCDAGYCPTQWQRAFFPEVYQPKIETIFDGVERDCWHRRGNVPRQFQGREIPPGTRIVTYVSRGFESIRGFDIFMKVAKRICDARQDVLIIAVGSDRDCYSGDTGRIKEQSYREHILAQDQYDLERILFPGMVPPEQLADLLSISDLHIYLTAPFVLSWSMLNAMSCGAVVLGSATGPVQEILRHEENGLLAGFFEVDELTKQALRVLDDPAAFRPLGEAAEKLIEEQYSLDAVLPRLLAMYERLIARK
ncbi:MAG: glycosyltransferase [Chthoniobacteraceae bacterium]